jgi:TATA-box binding protein (TBP) (component of TFIID and TFIIIB)
VESVKGSRDVCVDVVNVVATCRLPFKVNLESLAAILPGQIKLNPRYPKYRCAYVKVEGMKGVVTVFGSGAMISVGSRSVEDAERDLTIAYNTILSHIEQ